MHDGLLEPSVRVIESLQPIVDWMNEQHLCSSGTVPADATGGVVPPPRPRRPGMATWCRTRRWSRHE